MFKITFKLSSQISFIDRPCFDGILAYAWTKDTYGTVQARLSIPKEELIKFEELLPLKVHKSGVFLASQLFYNENLATEQTGSWKKRWANKHDRIADFGKNKRKVEVGKGEFKSYDMPMNLISTPEVWFFFESERPDTVNTLIERHINYLGKKRSQGFGEIVDMRIEQIETGKIIRPVPLSFFPEPPVNAEQKYCAWKPPYWLPDNFTTCVITEPSLL